LIRMHCTAESQLCDAPLCINSIITTQHNVLDVAIENGIQTKQDMIGHIYLR
jgi:hypothetical protein